MTEKPSWIDIKFTLKEVSNARLNMYVKQVPELREEFKRLNEIVNQFLIDDKNNKILGLLGATKSPLLMEIDFTFIEN